MLDRERKRVPDNRQLLLLYILYMDHYVHAFTKNATLHLNIIVLLSLSLDKWIRTFMLWTLHAVTFKIHQGHWILSQSQNAEVHYGLCFANVYRSSVNTVEATTKQEGKMFGFSLDTEKQGHNHTLCVYPPKLLVHPFHCSQQCPQRQHCKSAQFIVVSASAYQSSSVKHWPIPAPKISSTLPQLLLILLRQHRMGERGELV